MAKSTDIVKQKRGPGRPSEIAAEKFVGLRLPADLLERIDTFATANDMSRSEAIRHLVERGMPKKAKR